MLSREKGYAILDECIAHNDMKEDWQAFLCHFETNLDTEVGPPVCVYDLEVIRKKHDETACELVARIHHLASRAHIGDGSTTAIKFKVKQCFI